MTNGNIAVCTADGIPCVRLPKANKVPFILPAGKTVTDVMPDEARITKATVSLKNGRWFVSLAVESIIDLVTPAKTVSVREIMAGDVGLKEFRIRKSKTSGSGAGSVRNAEWSTTVTGMRRRISFTKGSGS